MLIIKSIQNYFFFKVINLCVQSDIDERRQVYRAGYHAQSLHVREYKFRAGDNIRLVFPFWRKLSSGDIMKFEDIVNMRGVPFTKQKQR